MSEPEYDELKILLLLNDDEIKRIRRKSHKFRFKFKH